MDSSLDKLAAFYIEVEPIGSGGEICMVNFYLQPADPAKRGIGKPPRVPRHVVVTVQVAEPHCVIEYTETQPRLPGTERADYEGKAVERVRARLSDLCVS